MFCGNCGTALNGDESVCPNCQNHVGNSNSEVIQGEAHVYNTAEEIKTKINATSLLVWSIVELLCCNQIFGIIALVLYLTLLQNEINAGNLQGAMKAKKTITWVLIGGLIFTVVVSLGSAIFSIVFGFLAEL